MKTMNALELKPITKLCSIIVNLNGPFGSCKNRRICDIIFIHKGFLIFEETGKYYTNKKEHKLDKLSLKMEMIIRNIMLNDEYAKNLTEKQLLGYITGKVLLLTGYSSGYLCEICN